MKIFNSVVIGCGQIGALYDIDNDLILTHAKGYYLSDKTNLKYVVDMNKDIAVKVSEIYNCDYKTNYKNIDYKNIDIVSICVPTEFHFEVLSYFYEIGYLKTILLEKPVVKLDEEIELLEKFNRNFLNNIYINYIRSYDSTYRDIFQKLKNNEYSEIEYIEVKYFKEFEHNGVHALNLFNRLFDIAPIIKYVDDKIIILSYNNVDVYFRSLSTNYTNYDIIIYTSSSKIIFDNLGYRVNIYDSISSSKFKNIDELALTSSKSILDGYILDLIDIIFDKFAHKPTIFDGIEDLKLIKEIMNVSNNTC